MRDVGLGIERTTRDVLQEVFVRVVFIDMLDDGVTGCPLVGADVPTAIVVPFQGIFPNQCLHEAGGNVRRRFACLFPSPPQVVHQFEQQPTELAGLAFIFGKIKGFAGKDDVINMGKRGAVGFEADMKDGDHIVGCTLSPDFVQSPRAAPAFR